MIKFGLSEESKFGLMLESLFVYFINMKRLKEKKNHISVSIVWKRHSTEFNIYSCLKKQQLCKLEVEGRLLNLMKGIYKTPALNNQITNKSI